VKIEPKVGEYWYFKYGSVNICVSCGKVVAIDENHILFYYNRDWSYPTGMQYIHVSINDIIGKWEPNFFFMLLGYK